MKTPRNQLRIAAASFFAAFMLSTPLSAQVIHKSIDAEGRTTFSDAPPQRVAVSPARQRFSMVNANEASRRLTLAENTRRLGKTPLSGESVQSANGAVMTSQYWRRQEKLRLVVEQALRRSNQTQQVLLANQ